MPLADDERDCGTQAELAEAYGLLREFWDTIEYTRVERAGLDRFLFAPDDLVLIVGQDGLVANVAKYLDGQLAVGVNPDPARYDGVLCRHAPEDVEALTSSAIVGNTRWTIEARVLAEALCDDGQRLLALNEIFVGHISHQSARYRLRAGDTEERHSSSGVIVSIEGYLLTNNHVVEGASDIEVQLADGRQAKARLHHLPQGRIPQNAEPLGGLAPPVLGKLGQCAARVHGQPQVSVHAAHRRLETAILPARQDLIRKAGQHRARHREIPKAKGRSQRLVTRIDQLVRQRKRLVNLLVEGLENIRHHIPADLATTAFALLVFKEGNYKLVMGNAAPQVTVASLTHRISILNEMDEADLREHHLKLLANEGRTERGGAGLGLLSMARKSSGPILTDTFARDNETAFLALELVLAA